MRPTKAQRKQLARDNAQQPERLQSVPRAAWPLTVPPGIVRVLRSRRFLVQQYEAPLPAIARLSVSRTETTGARWKDGITWDELQAVKAEAGFGEFTAVEVFPPDGDLVNVANMRHLWVLAGLLSFAWSSRNAGGEGRE